LAFSNIIMRFINSIQTDGRTPEMGNKSTISLYIHMVAAKKVGNPL
jgi:hypothetical protein